MKIKLAKTEIIHFIGIGGIGMSGLAIIMHGLGFKVQGSDISENKNLERLKSSKIKIILGHNKKNVSKSTIVVISSAIKKNNPELIEARKKKLPIYKRGEMLGHIVSLMKNIVVAGSHGKTTTTSLISSIFSKTNIDPTVINGGVINSYNNSAKLGKSEWCILESDESDGSFLNIPFSYSIVTNIDDEHLDYYKSLKNLQKYFVKFINKTPSFGKTYICLDNKYNQQILHKIQNKNYLTYGINKKSNFQIKNITQKRSYSKFDLIVSIPGKKILNIKNIIIPILGLHNIQNATASFAVCYNIGISIKNIKYGLKSFQGVQRRFNKIFSYRNSSFFDDYAHHPTEIKSVLEGIKSVYKNEEIICVFQPHRISRLNALKKKFVTCFKNADTVVLCPVYKAGENKILKFRYETFAKQIILKSQIKLIMINNEQDLLRYVKQNIFGNKMVIGMGAGTISNWMKFVADRLT